MAVINPIFTKDFPDLGRDIQANDLIVIAVPGDPVTYKTTAEKLRNSIFIYFTDSLVTGISSNKTTGVITLSNVATNFPNISSNGIIRANIDILKDGVWYSADVFPDVTKDISGNILTAVFNLGNTDITTIKGRIY